VCATAPSRGLRVWSCCTRMVLLEPRCLGLRHRTPDEPAPRLAHTPDHHPRSGGSVLRHRGGENSSRRRGLQRLLSGSGAKCAEFPALVRSWSIRPASRRQTPQTTDSSGVGEPVTGREASPAPVYCGAGSPRASWSRPGVATTRRPALRRRRLIGPLKVKAPAADHSCSCRQ
jgi:hypothetical protein